MTQKQLAIEFRGNPGKWVIYALIANKNDKPFWTREVVVESIGAKNTFAVLIAKKDEKIADAVCADSTVEVSSKSPDSTKWGLPVIDFFRHYNAANEYRLTNQNFCTTPLKRLEKVVNSIPYSRIVAYGVLVMTTITFLILISSFFSLPAKTTEPVKNEFVFKSPLVKYEWFKNAMSQLRRLSNDMTDYSNKQKDCFKVEDRLAIHQCILWAQELVNTRSAYNSIAIEYNAAASTFNWRVYNVDNIPTFYRSK